MSKLKDVRLKPVPIVLDKPRSIYFDFNAFAELEELYGTLDNLFKAIEQPTMKDLRNILWAGLLHELPVPQTDENGKTVYYDDGKPFTVHQVGKIMYGIKDLSKVTVAVFNAIAEAMPQVGKEEAEATEAIEEKK